EDSLDVRIGGMDLKPASESAVIAESDLPKMKGTFWGRNILGFAPFLSAPATFDHEGTNFNAELIGTYFAQLYSYGKEDVVTGVRIVSPWWKVDGDWPLDYSFPVSDTQPQVLVGRKLAEESGARIGDLIEFKIPHKANVAIYETSVKLRVSGILDTGGNE